MVMASLLAGRNVVEGPWDGRSQCGSVLGTGPAPDPPGRRPASDIGPASDLRRQVDAGTGRRQPDVRGSAEPLTQSELRVLRYLPTNLTQPEIAAELYVSANTVNTHISHLYRKLGAHRRGEAVECARRLGLLGAVPGRD